MRNANSPLEGPTGVIEGYLRNRQDLSAESKVLYRRVLTRLVAWMRASRILPTAGSLTLDLAEQYIEARRETIKASSARTEATVLKSFGHYIGERVIKGPSPLAGLRLPTPPESTKRALSDAELARVVGVAKRNSRDLAIVRVATGCGLRRSEIVALRYGDVDWQEGQIVVRGETSKSKRTRRVTMWPEVAAALDNYLCERPAPDDPQSPLFIARGGRAFKPQGLAALFRALAIATGISDLTPHLCRHTWSTNYLRKGSGDLIDMSREAGWRDKQNRMAWRYSHEKPITERRRRPSPFADVPSAVVQYLPRRRRTG